MNNPATQGRPLEEAFFKQVLGKGGENTKGAG